MKNVFDKPVFFGNVALRSVVSGILQESISTHPIERNSCDAGPKSSDLHPVQFHGAEYHRLEVYHNSRMI